VIKNLRTDFGAAGDGITDDTHAFVEASIFFNHLTGTQTGELVIDGAQASGAQAVYLIKSCQVDYNSSVTYSYGGYSKTINNYDYFKGPVNLFEIERSGITIRGDLITGNPNHYRPKIKYDDGLYYGGFVPPNYTYRNGWVLQVCTYDPTNPTSCPCNSGQPKITYTYQTSTPKWGCSNCAIPLTTTPHPCDVDQNLSGTQLEYTFPYPSVTQSNSTSNAVPILSNLGNDDPRTEAAIGFVFVIDNVQEVTIKDLEIDGNNINFNLGGVYGDKGIQAAHTGILCLGNLSMDNDIHLTNLYIHHMGLDGIEVRKANNVNMTDCDLLYNGRQALSWTGGIGIDANHCNFWYTGKAINNNTSTAVASAPGAGLDIEPEGCSGDCPSIVGCNLCHNGTFTNCIFKNNSGCEVVNDAACYERAALTETIKFIGCTFDDAVQNNKYNIWCKGNGFTFTNCNINTNVIYAGAGIAPLLKTEFIGCHFRDITSDGDIWSDGNTMVDIHGSYRVNFENCDFLVAHSVTNMIDFGITDLTDKDKWGVVTNCTFDYHFTGQPHSSFQGVKFKGNNTIKNTMNAPTTASSIDPNFIYLTTYQIAVIGSDDPCQPNSLNLEGQVSQQMNPNSVSPTDIFEIGKKVN
ncbi:MAG TPA: hypothetical protein PLJ79_12100, partial [Bacteroidia bacterium]|nr:hypothetical protein [Bacteroidia bacterium]